MSFSAFYPLIRRTSPSRISIPILKLFSILHSLHPLAFYIRLGERVQAGFRFRIQNYSLFSILSTPWIFTTDKENEYKQDYDSDLKTILYSPFSPPLGSLPPIRRTRTGRISITNAGRKLFPLHLTDSIKFQRGTHE